MEQENSNPKNQINIELTEEIADGTYANLAIIQHSFAEFVLDFANIMPGAPKAKVKSRIVMTPQHAKKLMRALIDNIKKYESQNGIIQEHEQVNVPFNPPAEA